MKSYLRWGTLAAAIVAAGLVVASRAPQNAATSAPGSGKTTIAASATKTTVLSVPGLNCGSCVATVGEVLNKIDGVADIQANPNTQEATVTYDPAKTTPEALAKAITDYEGGHDFTATVKSKSS